jgi:hypothetical protein
LNWKKTRAFRFIAFVSRQAWSMLENARGKRSKLKIMINYVKKIGGNASGFLKRCRSMHFYDIASLAFGLLAARGFTTIK